MGGVREGAGRCWIQFGNEELQNCCATCRMGCMGCTTFNAMAVHSSSIHWVLFGYEMSVTQTSLYDLYITLSCGEPESFVSRLASEPLEPNVFQLSYRFDKHDQAILCELALTKTLCASVSCRWPLCHARR